MTRPHSPVDEDLQRLYDEVWAGLDRMEESPSLPPLPPKPSAMLSASEPEYDEPPLSPTTSSSSHAHRYATLPPGAAKPIMPSIALESLERMNASRDNIRQGRDSASRIRDRNDSDRARSGSAHGTRRLPSTLTIRSDTPPELLIPSNAPFMPSMPTSPAMPVTPSISQTMTTSVSMPEPEPYDSRSRSKFKLVPHSSTAPGLRTPVAGGRTPMSVSRPPSRDPSSDSARRPSITVHDTAPVGSSVVSTHRPTYSHTATLSQASAYSQASLRSDHTYQSSRPSRSPSPSAYVNATRHASNPSQASYKSAYSLYSHTSANSLSVPTVPPPVPRRPSAEYIGRSSVENHGGDGIPSRSAVPAATYNYTPSNTDPSRNLTMSSAVSTVYNPGVARNPELSRTVAAYSVGYEGDMSRNSSYDSSSTGDVSRNASYASTTTSFSSADPTYRDSGSPKFSSKYPNNGIKYGNSYTDAQSDWYTNDEDTYTGIRYTDGEAGSFSNGTDTDAGIPKLPVVPPRPPKEYIYGSLDNYPSQNLNTNLSAPEITRRPSDMLRELAGDAPPRELIQPGSRFSIDSSPSGEAYRENGYQTDDRDRDDNYRVYDEEEYFDDPALDAASFVNYALLSHVAVQLRDRVSRSTHVQSGVRYPNSFSGKDIVTTIHALVQANLMEQGLPPDDRRVALQVARSLQSQLFFYEVEWGFRVLQDDAKAEDVYMFLDDDGEAGPSTSASGGRVEQEELPSGVMPVLARCYTPFCGEVVDGRTPGPCYAWDCPRKGGIARMLDAAVAEINGGPANDADVNIWGVGTSDDLGVSGATDSAPEAAGNGDTDTWLGDVDPAVLRRLPDAERNRQTIIHKIISKEAAYVQDMDTVIEYFIKPLQAALTSSPAASTFSTSLPPSSSSPQTFSRPLAASISSPSVSQVIPLSPRTSTSDTPGFKPSNGVQFDSALQTLDTSAIKDPLTLVKDVFSNLSELRACHARLLDILHVRQRVLTRKISQLATDAGPFDAENEDSGPDPLIALAGPRNIGGVGDIFLEAAAGFREVYPAYVGNHPIAERRLREATEASPSLRLFLEQCARKAATRASGGENADSHKPQLDLKHLLNRPLEHLQKYPVLLEAIYQGGVGEDSVDADKPDGTDADEAKLKKPVKELAVDQNPDAEFLLEAVTAIRDLHTAAQLRTFQAAMGRGTPGKWEWHDLVAPEVMQLMEKHERKRQAIMFEVIKGEMAYVKDLENIRIMYIEPLYAANPPIVPTARLDAFVDDVFHNYAELFVHHRTLLTRLHEIQREQHPTLRSITAPLYDAVLQFREAYIEYIPNYPIAAYRIGDETATNPAFKEFVEACVRHPDAHRLDMRNFINRPIPRLLRYELLLKGILEETPKEDPERPDLREIAKDRRDIPEVLDLIKALGKETEPGVVSAKQKVQLWTYNTHLVFKAGESGMTSVHDLDLLDPNRSLIHSGKLVRQPDSGLEWSGWPELFVILFDNYLVLTKAKERDGVTKYQVYRRPIPLDLLTIVNFTDPPTQRSTGLLRNLRGGERHETPASGAPESASDARAAYPCTIHHTGRLGGTYVLYAESAQARAEWKQKLEEALGIRRVVQESNKVFEVETLSVDTFLIPSLNVGSAAPAYNQDNMFTGKVTCSVPFNTIDGRGLVAVGCAEGVWIGFRHDPKSMRRVLHLKMVTQCAILNEFGIFLVLADKALFAYHIEALVPTAQTSHTSQAPQKLNGAGGVQFFRVGKFQGRTLVIYMKKKGLESIFRVLEPVSEQINARTRAPTSLGSRLGFRSGKSEWFRIYRDFFLPSESFDLIFLKAKIVILCTKGFEIMDIDSFQSVTIPQREDPRMVPLAKRCESSRPLGMFRSGKDEFLLCYDEFGLYVDKHGDPSRPAMAIEWEGTAQDVALHEPYVLLFDSRFIEVRHLETGRLCQIISGTEMRCIWDGRGADDLATQAPGAFQEARVHGVMSASDSTSPPSRGMSRPIAQQVFELLPTTPLSALGQSQSPSQSYIQSVDNSDPSTSRSSSWRS